MLSDERRKMENQLMVMGLKGLNDPELVIQMARIINDHPGFTNPHSFYLGMLGECPQEQRTQMYEALRPHLKFDVWPLEAYMRLLKEHASNVASHYDPVKISFADQEFKEVGREEADGVLVKVTCYKCTAFAEFYGDTVVTAITIARSDGWMRDIAEQKEVCPKCAAVEKPKPVRERTPEDAARQLKAIERRERKARKALLN
jgi:hypothetical protein